MRLPESAEDEAMMRIGLGLGRALEQFAQEVVLAIQQASGAHGVDPTYLRFVFERPSSGWPHLAQEDRRMLLMAAQLVEAFGTPGETELELIGLEQDHQADLALTWVARWCRRSLAPAMKRAYVAALALDLPTGPAADPGALQRLERFERWLHGPSQVGKQRSLAAIVDALFG